jgi:hypothetical protein
MARLLLLLLTLLFSLSSPAMGNLGDLGFSSFAAIGGAKEQHSSKATADDLSQYFRFEDGKWREATEGERISWCRDSIRAGLVTEMSGIKTYMDAVEIGGAAVASLPAILAAGSLEVGGAALVYGEGALTSIASTSTTFVGYTVTLGDALTIGGATWLLGTESGHEYVRQVGSSGLPTAQTAALVGVDAVAGMLSKGEATTTYVSEALDASSAKNGESLSPTNYPNPDPPMSAPAVRYEPTTIDEVMRMRQGKGPTTQATHGTGNIEAHHRQQVPTSQGGVIDDLTQQTQPFTSKATPTAR